MFTSKKKIWHKRLAIIVFIFTFLMPVINSGVVMADITGYINEPRGNEYELNQTVRPDEAGEGSMGVYGAGLLQENAENVGDWVYDSQVFPALGTETAVISTVYSEALNDMALQAIRNNFEFYQKGQAVDGDWGNFGAYDAYILQKAGAEPSSWIYGGISMASQVIRLADASIANEETGSKSSAKRIMSEYLAVQELGENERAQQLLYFLQTRQQMSGNGSFDHNGFSDIPALEMMGRSGIIDKIDTAAAINYILDGQDKSSGAWDLSWNDIMTTAEAVRVLAYLRPYGDGNQMTEIDGAISEGLAWLAARIKDNGSIQDDEGWDDPVIDTAEVICTLVILGIDPNSWASEYGNSMVDYLCKEAMNAAGVFGDYPNISANTWVLDACLHLGTIVASDSTVGLSMNPSNINIFKGQTKQFMAELYRLDGVKEDVTLNADWISDNPDIAGIDGGLAAGAELGNTNITARYGGFSCTAVITIEATSGSGSVDSSIKVYVAIVGSDGKMLLSPQQVAIDPANIYGLTAVAALAATNINWSQTGGLVNNIEGQYNQGMNGWMCKINGIPLSVSAFESPVNPNDRVIWWYSYDPYSNGPSWEDILSGNISAPVQNASTSPVGEAEDAAIIQVTEDIIGLYYEQLEQLGDENVILNADTRMNDAQAEILKNELDNNQVLLEQEIKSDKTTISDEIQEIFVVIPENAAEKSIAILIREIDDYSNLSHFAFKIGSSVYEFGPDGSEFAEPLIIGIKMPITEDLDISRLSPSWYDDEQKQWIPIPAIIDLETGLVLFKTDHFTCFSVVEFPVRYSFGDVGDDFALTKDAIEILAGKDIIQGSEGDFEPERDVTRAEFVRILIKALNIPMVSNFTGKFSDVTYEDWFAAEVETAWANGIVNGYPDTTFRPDSSITRYEAAGILGNLQADEDLSQVELSYTDSDDIPVWAREGLNFSCQANLINSYEDGSFQGDRLLSRAEAAFAVYQFLNYQHKTEAEL